MYIRVRIVNITKFTSEEMRVQPLSADVAEILRSANALDETALKPHSP